LGGFAREPVDGVVLERTIPRSIQKKGSQADEKGVSKKREETLSSG